MTFSILSTMTYLYLIAWVLRWLGNCIDSESFQLSHNESMWINTDPNQNMASEKQSPQQWHISDIAFVKCCINRKVTFFWEVKHM